MSHHVSGGQIDPGIDAAARLVKRGLEGGAALYALDHAAKGTPIGAEGDFAAKATRTAGNFVIVALLWHFVVVPYLIVTAVIFAIPTVIAAVIVSNHHAVAGDWWIVALLFASGLVLWVRYALYKGLWRKFIRPVDATLSGRRLDDPARQPAPRFKDRPQQDLVEYNDLSRQARERYLTERAGVTAPTPPAGPSSAEAGAMRGKR